ncbi:hypothetical protein LTR37_002593 [Vermiconidia calcicola]|uniref:Uncharacterized protein n=1 Tax=Vermiconidia calcicola TaxID=1690605 RepID=A0ACC3NSD0_9PEZI|nr:hypothetical protein LTR37_002593 [Vermiconidia calcicola]
MASIDVPASTHTVDVRNIDTTFRLTNGRPAAFMSPAIKGFDRMNALAFSFLITHKGARGNETTYLFDLGAPRDWATDLPPDIAQGVAKWERAGINVEVKQNLADILTDSGMSLKDIHGAIWSHPHWDHIGKPSLFPPKTDLIVGPGVKTKLGPGYPENEASPFRSEAFANRKVIELSFEQSKLSIGGLRAVDFFQDGSLYFLDAPGHAVGHINALARTSINPSTFIYMGGDSFHHPATLRPSEFVRLPESVEVPGLNPYPCPGDVFHPIHPCGSEGRADDTPFVTVSEKSPAIDVSAAREVVRKIHAFDADHNIMVIAAHDWSLLDVLELFPRAANDWKTKGWKEKGRWRFLVDFQKAVNLVRRQKL